MDKNSLRNLKIRPEPLGPVGALGDLYLRRVSMGAMSDLAKADPDGTMSARDLVSRMIASLVQKADDVALSDSDVSSLTASDRQKIVQAISNLNSDWFQDDGEPGSAEEEQSPDGSATDPEEIRLARAWRSYMLASRKRMTDLLGRTSERMKSMLGPGLAANFGASQQLGDLLNNLKRPQIGHAIDPVQQPFKLPDLPPNPIFETNKILGQVSDEVAQMRDIAAATAEMQRTLNATASTAVADFSVGAEATRKATRNGLWIAGASLIVSVLALGFSIYQMHKQDAESANRQQSALKQIDRLIASQKTLSSEMGQLQQEMIRTRQQPRKRLPSSRRRSSGG